MPLSDIKNKLYKKEEEKDLSSHDPSVYDPEAGLSKPESIQAAPGDVWGEKQKGLSEEQKFMAKKGLWALGIILGIIFILVAVYFIRSTAFSADRVTVGISGPKEADSGKLLTYEITYKNNNRAKLGNAVLKIVYPDNFKPEGNGNFKMDSATSSILEIPEIAGHKEAKVTFSGRMYSPRGALMYMKAELSFVPSGYSSRLVSQSQLGVGIDSSPVSIEVLSPQNVANGDEVNYLVTYKNTGVEELSNIKIRAEYPGGFSFSRSDPVVLEGNNIWYVGHLDPGQEGKITISGKLEGERDQVKIAKFSVGTMEGGNFVSYNDQGAEIKIASSPLSVSQTVNGVSSLNANAGGTLRFEITYKNEGDIGLRDVILVETIDSPVLDYSKLKIDRGGYYDQNKKTITWKASDEPSFKKLDPGQGGMIKFEVPVKEIIPISGENDKNFVISSVTKIDSPDIPTPVSMNKIISGNKMDVRLNSKLVLDAKGYYNDSSIPNSGPLPPKVGEETTYTLHWKVTNVSNDISGVRVEAQIPTNATMTGKFSPEDANIAYNERTNTLVWEIGNLKAGTGILTPPKEVAFQVKIKPSIDQKGREVDLLNEATISAKDSFTGEQLEAKGSAKDTQLLEDESIGAQNSKVKE